MTNETKNEFAILSDMIYDGSDMTGPDGHKGYRVYRDGGRWWATEEDGSDLHDLGKTREDAARYLTAHDFSH